MIRSVAVAWLAIAGLAVPALAQDKPAGEDFEAYAAKARQRIMALDTDGDGKISRAEFDARPRHGRLGKKIGARMFDKLDTNKDGYLDKSEIDAELARRFARLDANHDGTLTPDERHAMRGGAAGPEE